MAGHSRLHQKLYRAMTKIVAVLLGSSAGAAANMPALLTVRMRKYSPVLAPNRVCK